MSEHPTDAGHAPGDGTWRWLLGGLVGGAVVLGLLVAAYAVGHHRGFDAATRGTATTAAPAPAPAPVTTAPPAAKPAGSIGAVAVTPALVARGKALYTADGCAGCHSLTGAAGAGPSFKGLAGGTSTLTTGETVPADDAYLERSIVDPDAQIVNGYQAGIMAPAIAGRDFAAHPDDVRALVAFIKSQR